MALRTKQLDLKINDISREWIFEHYLNLGETLTGQTVSINSPFNAKDKTPSCKIYFSNTTNRYSFKDFSTGKSGDPTELVMELFHLPTRLAAVTKIISDYRGNGGKEKKREKITKGKRYKVNRFKTIDFDEEDLKFWKRFGIKETTLKRFNVKRISYFAMTKEGREILFNKGLIFGYFDRYGKLCRIYQPNNKDAKFIKVKDFIQGSNQLKYISDTLVILSSLKDSMSFTEMEFDCEVAAPESENIILEKEIIDWFKFKYKRILILFDNDAAGIKAARKYKEEYDLDPINLTLGKDVAECSETFGLDITKQFLKIEFNKLK